jgi:hypothetical protein
LWCRWHRQIQKQLLLAVTNLDHGSFADSAVADRGPTSRIDRNHVSSVGLLNCGNKSGDWRCWPLPKILGM